LVLVALACGMLRNGPAQAQSTAPHAWLYGSWSGGLFPPPPGLSASLACLTQPVVIFTRDVVLRASLAETTYTQRVIATARTAGNHTDFQFAPPEAAVAAGLVGATAPPPAGFGCPDPNVLNVERKSASEISFPGCADFPYPLVRCAAR
jgi:hypothetical protein